MCKTWDGHTLLIEVQNDTNKVRYYAKIRGKERPRILKICIARVLSLQSCPTLCDPGDCRPPGSSVQEILQARSWSRLPYPPPQHHPTQGSSQSPLLQADSLLLSYQGSPNVLKHAKI